MANITKTIGSGARDYSTIALWEADLDDGTNAAINTTAYGSGDVAIGEMYDDSVFTITATPIIDGGGTVGLTGRILRAATGEQHDGTAGTGVRMSVTTDNIRAILLQVISTDVEGIEINMNGNGFQGGTSLIGATVGGCNLRRLILHDWEVTQNTSSTRTLIGTTAGAVHVMNCMLYDCSFTNTGTGAIVGYADATTTVYNFINNTFYKFIRNSGSGANIGMQGLGSALDVVKNNIILDLSGTSSGTMSCYTFSGNAVDGNNMSSDATADDGGGSGCILNETAAAQFVSTVDGSEDLHLVGGAGCTAIDAAEDLGTTPTGVEIDINGRDRDAQGDTWDMGAHEFVAAAGGSLIKTINGLAIASVKTINGLAIASVKTHNGLTNV